MSWVVMESPGPRPCLDFSVAPREQGFSAEEEDEGLLLAKSSGRRLRPVPWSLCPSGRP